MICHHEAEWVDLYQRFQSEQAEYRADKARNWDALLEDPVRFRDLFYSLAAEKANGASANTLNILLEWKQCLTVEQHPKGSICLAQYLTGIVNAAAGGFFVFIVSACQSLFRTRPFFQGGGRGIVILPGWRVDSEDYSLLTRTAAVTFAFVYANDESSAPYPTDDKLITVSPGGDLVQAILGSDPVDDHGMPALKLSGPVRSEAITTSETLSIVRSHSHDSWSRELMAAVASYLAEIGRDGVYRYATPTLAHRVSSVGHAQFTVDPEPDDFGPRRPRRA
ncbi:hypothetical protein BMF94_2498 [Rhodotorula taiwanensis]|uniref:Uncharacterized protein n=1 Tax=Rhodotorula taiwanensis TaxID=741276 RepID=A0A2S5BC05_9BASI|nr:hypothetical protein BMF94_2498 [Rhodotorula taiwanensis]